MKRWNHHFVEKNAMRYASVVVFTTKLVADLDHGVVGRLFHCFDAVQQVGRRLHGNVPEQAHGTAVIRQDLADTTAIPGPLWEATVHCCSRLTQHLVCCLGRVEVSALLERILNHANDVMWFQSHRLR